VDALAEPQTQYSWLDVACGIGNVLHHVRNILKEKFPLLFFLIKLFLLGKEKVWKERANALYYFGFDLDYNHVRECQIVGDRMGLHVEAQTGQLEQLTNVYGSRRFDMVSLINALHELPMRQFPSLFLDMFASLTDDFVLRFYLCSNDGRLAIFDMAKLLEIEPGALPISDEEMQPFLDAFLSTFGVENVSQPVSKCQFSTTEAFFFRLRKNLVPNFDKLYEQAKERFVSELLEKWREILIHKLATLNQNIYQLADELFLMASEKANTTDKLNELSSLTQQFWACYNELKTF
jgi:hypothetical protein